MEVADDWRGENSASEGSVEARRWEFENDLRLLELDWEPLRHLWTLFGGDPGRLVVLLGLPSYKLLSVEQRLLRLPFLEVLVSQRLYSQRTEPETQRSQPSFSPLHFN